MRHQLGHGEARAAHVLAHVARGATVALPIAASTALVYVAAQTVSPPAGVPFYVLWWAALSLLVTAILVWVGRLVRALLPLPALLRLSFLLPDGAPSRFRVALRSMTVGSLRERLERGAEAGDEETPAEAAARLLGLVALLDSHDALTRGHSERVRAYAQTIGRELGLTRRELALLNWAALLHDVGKLQVPREVLRKREALSDDEWALIRAHPQAGADLARPLHAWLGEWALGIEQHHERFDGSGYPHGLRGDEISLAGRIIAVADAFDVITSARPYSETASAAEARAELARLAGTQFDPHVVRTFLGISVRSRRLVSGPLAWLAQAPVLARIPVAASTGAVAATVATVAAPVPFAPGAVAQSEAETPIAIVERPVARPTPRFAPEVRALTRRAASSTMRRRAAAARATQPPRPSTDSGAATTLAVASAGAVKSAERRSSKEPKPAPRESKPSQPARRTPHAKASARAQARSAHTRAVPPRGLAEHRAVRKDDRSAKGQERQATPPPTPAISAAEPGPPETPPGHEDGDPQGKSSEHTQPADVAPG